METEIYQDLIPLSQSDQLLRSWGYDLVDEYFSVARQIAPTDSPVLELATGTGRMCAVLSTMFPIILSGDITLSDLYRVLQRIPKRYIDHVHFAQINMENLPFLSDSIPVIVCMNTLHELSDPSRCLLEMIRVIGRTGTFAIGDFNRIGFEAMQNIHKSVYHNDHQVGPISISEIQKKLASSFLSVRTFETQLNTTFFASGKL